MLESMDSHALDPSVQVSDPASGPDSDTVDGTSKSVEERCGASLDIATLYDDYHSKLVYHLKCRGARRNAEELAQETFVKAATHLDTLKDPDKVWPWLRQIGENLLVDGYRDEGRFVFKNYEAMERVAERDRSRPWDEYDPEEMTDPLTTMDDLTGLDDASTADADDWDDAERDAAERDTARWADMVEEDAAGWADAVEAEAEFSEDALETEFPSEPDVVLEDEEDEDGEDGEEAAGEDGVPQRRQRRQGSDDGFAGKARLNDLYWRTSPERVLTAKEHQARCDFVDAMVPTLLPPNQRRAVLLRYTEELSYAEIGRCLGIAPSTARVHVTRAMERLRALFSGERDDFGNGETLPSWLEQAEARANAGDEVGAARARALAGWHAASTSVRYSNVLRHRNPDGRLLDDPAWRDSDEAREVRRLLELAQEEVPRAVEVLERFGLVDEAADAWIGLGVGLHKAELFESARVALLSGLDALRRTQSQAPEHRSEMAFVLRTLGCVYTGLELFKEGRKVFKQASAIFRKLGDPDELARTTFQAAELLVKQGLLSNARALHEKALKQFQRLGNRRAEAYVRWRLATLGRASP